MDMTAAQDKEVELSEVQVEIAVDGEVVLDEELDLEPTSEIKLVAEVDVDIEIGGNIEVTAEIDVTVDADAPLVGGDGDCCEELDEDEIQQKKANKAVASIVFTINRFILFCCFIC